jgi:hypothetical protein
MSDNLFSRLGEFLHRERPWYRLPRLLAMPRLVQIRNEEREKNLYDTEEPPLECSDAPAGVDPKLRGARTADGTFNDLRCPHMGAVGARFGRNVPLEYTFPDTANLLKPNPRTVSQSLLTRHEFQPATKLNLLAAAWIQFEIHDWFSHTNSTAEVIDVPDEAAGGSLRIPRTEPSPAPQGSSRPPAYANEVTHWWDGSQIYGSAADVAARHRSFTDGKLKIRDDGLLAVDPDTRVEHTPFTNNWWVGLSMLHHLFVREHNAICDFLKSHYPAWTDDELYGKARLINAALMAKIHTVEWTPAIISHPVIKVAMRTNWYGLAGDDLQDVFEFLDDSEVLGGIVGSKADHHAAPYSLTEEFIAVYRMHPLMPDDFTFRSVSTDAVLDQRSLPEVAGRASRDLIESVSMTDLFYSFGRMHPGALTLHNYPRHLQAFKHEDGSVIDVAMVDILRDRERGVPRYNQFRRLFHKEPVKSFEELTDNAAWREEIRALYNNDIESVDLMVGLFAEPLPDGFGFSETAFRVFILMASRRLKSDRFYTDDYRPEIYTQEGLDYIHDNGMVTVLKRHYPELAPAIDGVENPFAPWKSTAR